MAAGARENSMKMAKGWPLRLRENGACPPKVGKWPYNGRLWARGMALEMAVNASQKILEKLSLSLAKMSTSPSWKSTCTVKSSSNDTRTVMQH